MFVPMTIVLPPDDLLPFNEVVFQPSLSDYGSAAPEVASDPRDPELDNGDQDPEVPTPPTPHPGPPQPGDPIGKPPSPGDPAPQPPLPGGPGPVKPNIREPVVF